MKNLLTKALGIAGITALSFLPMNGKGQDIKKTTQDREGKVIELEEKFYSTKESQWHINNIPVDSITIKRQFEYDSKDNLICEVRFSNFHNPNLKNLEETFQYK